MSSSRKSTRSGLGATVTMALLMSTAGCGYPEVGEQAMELAKAVDNLCNLQEASRIEPAREIVNSEHSNGTITDDEQTYLLDILDTAEGGDWESAQQESRRLLVDQQRW